MAGDSTTSARPSSSTSNPLRRRIHLLERAASASASHRSFSVNTADSSTRNGDAESEDLDERSLPSPPTSFEAGYDEDEDGEEEGERPGQGDDGAEPLTELQEADEDENEGDGDGDGGHEEEYITPDPRPWYKPSIPVLLALAPPIGNWLTGGDHLKDLLLLLLLVFYLHQLVEVPWSLYHAARPRRPPPPPPPHPHLHPHPTPRVLTPKPPHPPSARSSSSSSLPASSSPRSASSSFGPSPPSPPAACPARNSASPSRGSARPSSRSSPPFGPSANSSRASLPALPPCTPSCTSPPPSSTSTAAAAQVADLRAKVERLERALEQMAEREEALYAYVEDALAPLEKGKELVAVAAEASTKGGRTTTNNTIFVPAPAPARPTTVQGLIGSWFSPSPMASAAQPTSKYAAPISPTNGKRRALDSIPEEGEGEPSSSSTFYPARTEAYAKQQHVALIPLLRQWLASCLALALYPLYVVLLPVRGSCGRRWVGREGECRVRTDYLPWSGTDSPAFHLDTRTLRPGLCAC
ncbi:OTU domain-containing protein [Mycena venus]|uniref:OTU domain-containing protein n=1 Tax=Mycena venus TaxID=2733690 RepID=A0A8H6XR36_9AGAR|nr:OTU domain-containing protein [Mycena venus]